MRLASFNVENMFRRPKALDQVNWNVGKPILEAYSKLQELLGEASYSTSAKQRIAALMTQLGLDRSDESDWVILRRSRGQLLRRPRQGPITVTATGRGDWIGWLELKREAVDEAATRNTARVVADLDADVLTVIEAEDRPALVRFNLDVLPHGFTGGATPWSYPHVMLVDGNDDRGIDVGIFTRDLHPIQRIRSHVDDRSQNGAGELIFSRDCAEYEITVDNGDPVLLLVNHFKSKGYGAQSTSNAKRLGQAQRVRDIYQERRAQGHRRIAVTGDLNDTPSSAPLAPLITETDLRDASDISGFDFGPRKGTFGTSNDKIDYLLLSPELFAAATGGGILRSGVWRGPRVKNPWPMYNTISRPEEAASDHAAIWVDLNI
jgi:endonuclease/exonuclease/phosphatase family metal-dependent hydrolase